MNAIIERFKQGSTHAGLAAVSQVIKIFFPQWAVVFDAATALLGSLAVVINN
jgi:hypothetical protein